MNEEFLVYELSFLLKTKGFNENCFAYYKQTKFDKKPMLYGLRTKGESEYSNTSYEVKGYGSKSNDNACSAILRQQATSWLKENHKILISENWNGWCVGKYDEDFNDFKTFELALEYAVSLINS